MTDEFTGIFDNLTPGDFDRDTSAIDTCLLEEGEGAEAFLAWLSGMNDITWHRAIKEDFQPFAVLTNENTQRIFASDADETVEHWAARLQREAQGMKATWFFLAMVSAARAFDEGDDVAHIEPTTEQIDAALDAGVLDTAVCWVSVRNDAQGREEHAGMIRLNEVGLPLDSVVGTFTEDNPFINVLGGADAH